MGIARQICQHGPWSGERFFGIDDPFDFAQWFEESIEGGPVNKFGVIAKEPQPSGFVQPD